MIDTQFFRQIRTAIITPLYDVYELRSGAVAILHHACGNLSFHPDDVANRYCGHCHAFLDAGARLAPGIRAALDAYPEEPEP